VTWYDIVNLWLNYDVTQITWSYNGSSVSAGSVQGFVGWRSGSGWGLVYAHHAGSYGAGNSYYLGNTWSKMGNPIFCPTPPIVYTVYSFNKVWGHPSGTATRSQSSDSIDECLPFHFDIQSAYGTWPG
jgi:hypothetical protein